MAAPKQLRIVTRHTSTLCICPQQAGGFFGHFSTDLSLEGLTLLCATHTYEAMSAYNYIFELRNKGGYTCWAS
jgi:hypothetical protein